MGGHPCPAMANAEAQRAAQRRYRNSEHGRTKRNEDRRQRQAAKRAALAEYKVAAGCADCGYDTNAHALEFHHDPPLNDRAARRVGQGASSGWSWERLMAEVAKCVVLCANCHAIRERS
jgi:hypothetical protein